MCTRATQVWYETGRLTCLREALDVTVKMGIAFKPLSSYLMLLSWYWYQVVMFLRFCAGYKKDVCAKYLHVAFVARSVAVGRLILILLLAIVSI